MYSAAKIFEQIPNFPSCHGSTIAEMPDGELLAAWYAGSREGAKDVAIFASRKRTRQRSLDVPENGCEHSELLGRQPCLVCRCEPSDLAVLRYDVWQPLETVQDVLPEVEHDGK